MDMFLSDVKARQDKMGGSRRRVMSDTRGAMSAGRDMLPGRAFRRVIQREFQESTAGSQRVRG